MSELIIPGKQVVEYTYPVTEARKRDLGRTGLGRDNDYGLVVDRWAGDTNPAHMTDDSPHPSDEPDLQQRWSRYVPSTNSSK